MKLVDAFEHSYALVAVHAIGDRANREALDAFERVLRVDPQSQSAKQNAEFVKQRIKDKEI